MRLFLCFLTLSILQFSCKKDEIDTGLIGKWQWVSSSGGLAGLTYKPENGERRVIEFTENSEFKRFINDSLTLSTHYEINLGETIMDTAQTEIILYEAGSPRQSFSVRGNYLTLYDELFDGFTHEYMRVNK